MSCPLGSQTTRRPGGEGDHGDAVPALLPRGLHVGPHRLACLKPGVWPRQKHRKNDLHGRNEIIIYRITLSQRHFTYLLEAKQVFKYHPYFSQM